MRYFDLDGNEITKEHFIALYSNDKIRLVKQTFYAATKTKISTVWLGIDHQFDPAGPPLLFETTVFGGPMDQYMRRYSTREEAIAGHDETVALEAMERQFV